VEDNESHYVYLATAKHNLEEAQINSADGQILIEVLAGRLSTR